MLSLHTIRQPLPLASPSRSRRSRTHARTHAHAHTRMHACTHTHVRTHTHTHSRARTHTHTAQLLLGSWLRAVAPPLAAAAAWTGPDRAGPACHRAVSGGVLEPARDVEAERAAVAGLLAAAVQAAAGPLWGELVAPKPAPVAPASVGPGRRPAPAEGDIDVDDRLELLVQGLVEVRACVRARVRVCVSACVCERAPQPPMGLGSLGGVPDLRSWSP